jgi:hypothetical protein
VAKDDTVFKVRGSTATMLLKLIGGPVIAGGIAAGGVGMIATGKAPDPDDIKETKQALQALRESAPTRKEVEELFNLFREMRDSQLRMEARQTALDNGQARDRSELQRQIDDNKRLLDKFEKSLATGVSRAEFDALKAEVARLRDRK